MTSSKPLHASKQNGSAISSDGGRKRTLSRSPHPYRRRGNSLSLNTEFTSPAKRDATVTPSRPSTSNSSDSGTEADDERGGSTYLRVLPAPPLRGRKGLRGATPEKHTPAVSPLPTPPLAEDVATSFFTRVFPPQKEPAIPARKRQHIREKYTKRKRAEITRRTLETLLLFGIGLATYKQASTAVTLQRWGPEIAGFLLAVILPYLAYPVRITWVLFRLWRTPVYAVRRGFHIPSRFDLGPLLYPVFVPPFVAASLFHQMPALMLPNMLLGLSSLPMEVIPYYGLSNHVHWTISVTPFIAAKVAESFAAGLPTALKYRNEGSIKPEALSLLYPLHIALVPTLDFLVTTSLDPAELQLLSVALINLFLFASSPQAQILKALLWLGGVAIFVSCQKVLGWEVTLARIPKWKFQRERRQQRSFLKSLDISICQQLTSLTSSSKSETLSEDDASNIDCTFKPLRKLKKTLTLDTQRVPHKSTNGQPRSAVVSTGTDWSAGSFSANSIRRDTFSAEDGERKLKKTTPGGRLRRSMTPNSSAFLNLTSSQALVRKWMYAVYSYAVVLLVVLVLIRAYVSKHALSEHEPFGWALGYLFGNIPNFRFQVVYHSLERWIQLPAVGNPSWECLTGAEYIRQVQLGPANTRLAVCAYCVTVLLVGIAAVLKLTSLVEVDTRRKVFHGIMVAMLLPTIFVDPCFIALALNLILAVFLLLDLFRASQLPPISRPLTNFLAPYVDGRDHRGPIVVSPIFLLIGCAIPLWLSLAGLPRSTIEPWTGWEVDGRDLSMVSGVICVGMGDAAASLIGRRYGKTKWFWGGGKSLEGSVAFTVAVTAGLMMSYVWLVLGGWMKTNKTAWFSVIGKAALAAAGASMTETLCTSANDNVIVPLALWLLVRGLDI